MSRWARFTRGTSLAIAAATAAVLACGAALVVGRAALRATLVAQGSVRTVTPGLLVALGLVAAALGLAVPGVARRQAVLGLVVVGCGALTVAGLIALGGFTWTYYATKTAWLVACSTAFLPFAALARWPGRLDPTRRVAAADALARLAAAGAVLVVLADSTGARNPVGAALTGRSEPSPAVVGRLVEAADAGRPVLFWGWSGDFGDDRMGNFWAALAGSTGTMDVAAAAWAYASVGEPAEVCTRTAADPDLVVLTRDPGLAATLSTACGRDVPVLVER